MHVQATRHSLPILACTHHTQENTIAKTYNSSICSRRAKSIPICNSACHSKKTQVLLILVCSRHTHKKTLNRQSWHDMQFPAYMISSCRKTSVYTNKEHPDTQLPSVDQVDDCLGHLPDQVVAAQPQLHLCHPLPLDLLIHHARLVMIHLPEVTLEHARVLHHQLLHVLR